MANEAARSFLQRRHRVGLPRGQGVLIFVAAWGALDGEGIQVGLRPLPANGSGRPG